MEYIGILSSDLRNDRNDIAALPFCNLRLKAKKPRCKAYPQKVLTLGDAIRKRRLDLGLLQKDVALILGCDQDSVIGWEKGRTTPQIGFTGKIIAFIGYNPMPKAASLAERLKEFRKIHSMRQNELALELGMDPSTLARYERGRMPKKDILAHIEGFLATLKTLRR